MRKKVYAIFDKDIKDSTLITAKDDEECIDTVLAYIFDNEEFDEFFDLDGKIRLTNANKDYFYEVLSNYQLYLVGFYDSETMKIEQTIFESNDLKQLLQAMNNKLGGNIYGKAV